MKQAFYVPTSELRKRAEHDPRARAALDACMRARVTHHAAIVMEDANGVYSVHTVRPDHGEFSGGYRNSSFIVG
jgi:hypothetical protein